MGWEAKLALHDFKIVPSRTILLLGLSEKAYLCHCLYCSVDDWKYLTFNFLGCLASFMSTNIHIHKIK